MTKRLIFHTPQKMDENIDSGSNVRPRNLIQAFKHAGYDVACVSGTAKERKRRIKKIFADDEGFDFCYSEPTAWPLNPLVDYRLYRYLWTEDIPTGVFYRDVYWKFSNLFDVTGLKRWELQLRYRLDLAVLTRVADKMYFPSESFGDFLGVKTSSEALPPGGKDRIHPKHQSTSASRGIYVGGVSHRYGTDILARALNSVAQTPGMYFDLVCRQSEFESLSSDIRQALDSERIEIHHRSGDELVPLYRRADVGIVPLRPTEYNNMAMPVKLFEYLSYGLPIVATTCDEIESFVRSHDCGVVSDPTSGAMADTITALHENDSLFQEKQENAVIALNENKWSDRVSKVASDLDDQG